MRNNRNNNGRGQSRSSNQWQQRNRDNQGQFTSDRFYNRNSGMRSSEDRYPYSHEWYEGSDRGNNLYDENSNRRRGGFGNYNDDSFGSYRNTGRGYGNDPESFESSYDRSESNENQYGNSMRDGRGYGSNRGQNSESGRSWNRNEGASFGSDRSEYGNGSGHGNSWDRGQQGSSWGSNSRENTMSNRGKGPKGYQRSDERIREDIHDQLSDDNQIDASELEVKVEKGEVTLSGTVPERDDKRRAEDIAESVSGVKNVENRIRVSDERSNSTRDENSRASNKSNERSKTRESVA